MEQTSDTRLQKITTRFDWKLFAVLLLMALLGVAAVIPYSLSLQGLEEIPLPTWLILLLTLLQNALLFAVVIGLGLWLGGKIGLGAPHLQRLLGGHPGAWPMLREKFPLSMGMGLAAALIIILLDGLLFSPLSPPALRATAAPPAWQGLLASLYGGISEELLMRLGLMTVLMWTFTRVAGHPEPNAGAAWSAILIAALLFGVGHLPATAAIAPLTRIVIARALILNGIGGLAFGWLYWRQGLLPAMVAHFSADILLHVILPLVA
jgi:membrane protease YdiL (CAAX protease family)